jgi:hypothetical protein
MPVAEARGPVSCKVNSERLNSGVIMGRLGLASRRCSSETRIKTPFRAFAVGSCHTGAWTSVNSHATADIRKVASDGFPTISQASVTRYCHVFGLPSVINGLIGASTDDTDS